MIKISAVSYTNTKPFIYGLKYHSNILNKINLSLDIPSVCAKKLAGNEVDIGLVPVAILPYIPNFEIISNYCIGANGPVNSVFIFSDTPIEQVKTLRLDFHSRTSNNLAKVLLKNYWKVSPSLVEIGDAEAFVEIGDRTFGKKKCYPYVYDLSEVWTNFTGLPFVFAVWVANKSVDTGFVNDFNAALKYGLDNRSKVIDNLPQIADFDLHKYLTHQIDYEFDNSKKQALEKFLDLVNCV